MWHNGGRRPRQQWGAFGAIGKSFGQRQKGSAGHCADFPDRGRLATCSPARVCGRCNAAVLAAAAASEFVETLSATAARTSFAQVAG
jgi:hypothetical protein